MFIVHVLIVGGNLHLTCVWTYVTTIGYWGINTCMKYGWVILLELNLHVSIGIWESSRSRIFLPHMHGIEIIEAFLSFYVQ